ncbi:crustacyanin subunit C [Penaeus vannamei]|uniref:Crustacyanin subunit C n=1 Tax=Penaeus vannamei TaxID=6689 RepID=A0A423U505_PENVA|nr:crustacyanin subunit C [Penaeus vannamei]
MKSAVFFVAFVAAVAADKIPDFLVPGKCPAVNEKALFEQQIPNHSKDGSKFIAKSTGINADGNLMRHNGQVLPMPLGDPHLSIDYEGSFTAPYVILDTDYENFSCIYSCVEFNYGYYADFAFIFSRSPSLSDQYLRRCEAAFKEIGVDVSRFEDSPGFELPL